MRQHRRAASAAERARRDVVKVERLPAVHRQAAAPARHAVAKVRLLALPIRLMRSAEPALSSRATVTLPVGHDHAPCRAGHQPVTRCTARHNRPAITNVIAVRMPLPTDASWKISAMAKLTIAAMPKMTASCARGW